MTTTTKTTTINGLTLEEHRDMGRAFGTLISALDKLARSESADDSSRSAYGRMNESMDGILDGCADLFVEAYYEAMGEWCGDSDYPYPRFAIDGTMLPTR